MLVENQGEIVIWTQGSVTHYLELLEALELAAELIRNTGVVLARRKA